MIDMDRIIMLIEQLHGPKDVSLEMTRDQISNIAIRNKVVAEVIETLKGIANGNISLEKD